MLELPLTCPNCGFKVSGVSKATCGSCNLEMLDSLDDAEILKRVKNFNVEQLKNCYVLYDRYWDDGLNDEETLKKIKLCLGVLS